MLEAAADVAVKPGSWNQMPGKRSLNADASTPPLAMGISIVLPVLLSVIEMLSVNFAP